MPSREPRIQGSLLASAFGRPNSCSFSWEAKQRSRESSAHGTLGAGDADDILANAGTRDESHVRSLAKLGQQPRQRRHRRGDLDFRVETQQRKRVPHELMVTQCSWCSKKSRLVHQRTSAGRDSGSPPHVGRIHPMAVADPALTPAEPSFVCFAQCSLGLAQPRRLSMARALQSPRHELSTPLLRRWSLRGTCCRLLQGGRALQP